MRTTVITICKQTHAECQGFACDDHIEKDCHSVYFETPEIEEEVIAMINQIDIKSGNELQSRSGEWAKNNPNEEECLAEGKEFIGHIWVEWSPSRLNKNYVPQDGDKSGVEILKILKATLDQFEGPRE